MAEIEEKIVFEGDASSLVMTFDQLVNAITQTREELRQYKDDKEKSAELTKKLADQEEQLVQLMAKNNNVIDASKVSYKQLNDILKDLNKTYKQTTDAAQRMDIAPASKALNQELKNMDANIGNYHRNIGNYAGDIDKAFANVRLQTSQVLRELPSLKFGVEQFFLAISNNLPMFVDAIKGYNDLQKARKASAANATTDAVAHKAEATETSESTIAHEGEAKAVSASAAAHIKEAENALKDAQAKQALAKEAVTEKKNLVDSLTLRQQDVDAQLLELQTQNQMAEMDVQHIGRMSQINQLKRQRAELDMQLTTATYEYEAAQEKLASADLKVAAAEKTVNDQRNAQTAGGALKAIVKVILSWQTALLVLIMALTLYGKEIGNFFASLFKGNDVMKRFNDLTTKAGVSFEEMGKSAVETTQSMRAMNRVLVNSADGVKLFMKEQLELNKAMMEGAKGMAKEYVEIRLLDSIIQDAGKSQEEHNKAAAKLVEIIDDTNVSTRDVTNQTDAYKNAIDELIKNLYKQAEAQGAITLLQQKYTETVLKAQGELLDAELLKQENKFKSFWQGLGFWMLNIFTPAGFFKGHRDKEDFLDAKVKKWQKQLDNAKTEFEAFLAEITKMFNFDELFSGDDNGGGKSGPDNWFSKWEMFIKKAETLQGTFVGEFQNLNLAEAWKYSQAGMEAYMKKFDEYVAHYKGDVKQLKEIEIQRLQYIEERYQYQQKLIKQYASTDKTEKDREIAQLEEWYSQQKLVYKTAGVDITDLVAEYNNRLEAIQRKYVDKYVNVGKEGLELELANLQDAFEKEKYEYEKKGIETVNLEKHYAEERLKIISKYAKEEADAAIEQIKRQEDARKRLNEVSVGWANQGGTNRVQELNYARVGGTTMTGHQTRQNEIEATFNDYNIWKESADAQIAEMERVLASGKLVGEQKLEMEQALADAQQEVALGTAEYQMQLNQMVLDDTRETTEEMLSYIQTGFQGLGSIFDDVYTAIERTTEAEVKQGKLSQKEADKRLDEYRGVKAAAAAMDALGSAVGAYNSLASIPYVGPALGAAAAAAALAAGFANVKLIMATTKDNVGGGNDSYANVAPSLSEFTPQYTQNVTGKDDTDYLVNALSEKPIHCYVTESEVTAAQEIANKRTSETTW